MPIMRFTVSDDEKKAIIFAQEQAGYKSYAEYIRDVVLPDAIALGFVPEERTEAQGANVAGTEFNECCYCGHKQRIKWSDDECRNCGECEWK